MEESPCEYCGRKATRLSPEGLPFCDETCETEYAHEQDQREHNPPGFYHPRDDDYLD